VSNFKLDSSRDIGDFKSPYIVAELNTSHFGDIEKAKEMIEAAKKAGCDCVKFQSWSEESLYSETYYARNPMARRFIKRFSFSAEELFLLSEFCKDLEIDFSSTPYSNEEVDFLVDKCKVPFLKVASMDLVNLDLLTHMSSKQTPIVLSTGMGSIEEIEKAVETIIESGNNRICILHCVSLYPTQTQEMNLQNILGLREIFGDFPIGFSDHSEGSALAIAATALGAALIEKHFTLDKTKIGMDNQMAMETNELAQMIQGCRDVFLSLGDKERKVSESEINQRKIMRRSLVSSRDLAVGHTIQRDDIIFKRPGDGIQISDIDSVVGKTVIKNISSNCIIEQSDIEN
jgi:N-acetylneuraminate synthase